MRLSLGQDLRMVQKQVLAPRMIQSMEILQLPILALQERIEQEMEENPVLEVLEEEARIVPPEPEELRRARSPRRPLRRRAGIGHRRSPLHEGDFERLMKMDEQWPDHFEERTHLSREQIEEAGERKLDAMANMVARPQSLQDYLYDQLGWFDLDPELRALADRIIANLDTNGYLQGRLEDLLGPNPSKEDLAMTQRALSRGAKTRSARRGRKGSASECLLLQLTPGMPYYEELKTLIFKPSGRPGTQPPADHQPAHRLFHRVDSKGASRAAQAESQAGRRFYQLPRAAGHARRVRRAGRSTAATAFVWKTATRRACTSAHTIASCCKIPKPARKPANTSSAK